MSEDLYADQEPIDADELADLKITAQKAWAGVLATPAAQRDVLMGALVAVIGRLIVQLEREWHRETPPSERGSHA